MTRNDVRRDAAVAVVGTACRLPAGINDSVALRELLNAFGNVSSEVPRARWSEYERVAPEWTGAVRDTWRMGGYLDDPFGFDAAFFGVSPREAAQMDPQHRIMLEVAWEALENAGIDPTSLAGGDGGVFVGIGPSDHGRRVLEDLPRVEAWSGIGAAQCGAANRVSYALDLRGSSIAVDTACSASLVAVHLACESLRRGECDLAVVGGIGLSLTPGPTRSLQLAGAIAADGRSKPFDADADGYGRSEGCGVVVLQRVSDARRAGNPVRAVLLGSAVVQDGRTNGIMEPSADAQADMIRKACASAGVDPGTVDYVEAHGTGTRLGDKVEAAALAEVYGRGRQPGAECLIGSVKSNVGHLEAASGIVGLIKTVRALRDGVLPPTRLSKLSPAIDWDDNGLRVVTEPTPWPAEPHRVRRAGVSSFGYGGTIAHVVLQEGDPAPRGDSEPDAERAFVLSAASEQALRDQARALADHLAAESSTGLADVAHTLALRRARQRCRAAVVARSREDVVSALRALSEGDSATNVVRADARPESAPVWVFSGHGSQWDGMARDLLDSQPVFAAVLDRLAPVYSDELGWTPAEVLAAGQFSRTDVIQPMIFAVQVGLAAVLESWGQRPAAVIGHSVGEIAAAVAARVLDLDEAARLACRRSRLLGEVAGKGRMLMVALPADEVAPMLPAGVEVAVHTSPASTVVSGGLDAVVELAERWRAEGLTVREVSSDVAFHSAHMDSLVEPLVAALTGLRVSEPAIPLYSTAFPDTRTPRERSASYWAANLRNAVHFSEAVTAALEDGHTRFLEISPHPVVTHSVDEVSSLGGHVAFATGTLRRHRDGERSLLFGLAAMHCDGAEVDWRTLAAGRALTLPATAWQHRAYRPRTGHQVPHAALHDPAAGHLLGASVRVHARTSVDMWTTYLDDSTTPCMPSTSDIPVSVLVATALAAGGTAAAEDMRFGLALPVSGRTVQVTVQEGQLRLSSWSDDAGHESGAPHLEATLCRRPLTPRNAFVPSDLLPDQGEPTVRGENFPWTAHHVERTGDTAVALVTVAQDTRPTWAAALDAALSLACPPGSTCTDIGRVAVVGNPLASIVVLTWPGTEDATTTIHIATAGGRIIAELEDVRFRSAPASAGAQDVEPVHQVVWRPAALTEGTPPTGVVLIGGSAEAVALVEEVAAVLRVRCARVHDVVELDRALPAAGPRPAVIVPASTAGNGPVEAAQQSITTALKVLSGLKTANVPGARLWFLTDGVRDSGAESAPAQLPLWGLGRVLEGEHPELWGGVLDVRQQHGGAAAPDVALALSAKPGESVLAHHAKSWTVPRLVPFEPESRRDDDLVCRPDASYLVTGGLGALGVATARWLVGRGARRLVLITRTPLPPRSRWDEAWDKTTEERVRAVRALEALGAVVRVVACDIADVAAVSSALSVDALGFPEIHGVVHAAGVLDSRMAVDVDGESVRTVLSPKARGAWVLHELFPPGTLDFFALFSSCGQLLGLPGQATYAAANSFLDGLAQLRRAKGCQGTTSWAWTSWQGMGMGDNRYVDAELAAQGIGTLTTDEAFAAWQGSARRAGAYVAVLPVVPTGDPSIRRAVLSELSTEADGAAPTRSDEQLLMATVSPEERRRAVLAFVRKQVGTELGMAAEEIAPDTPFGDYGMDSVMSTALARRLGTALERRLPPSLLITCPTINDVIEYLLSSGEEHELPTPRDPAQTPQRSLV
ncbi:type I polyketide synthase [Saccharopolyspora hattusasensis]|uniref:type I polyketide synthase n=1 Tax=Saccharopolyspora hattusasensis TaxID=1128679 RepID=UPI003D97A304